MDFFSYLCRENVQYVMKRILELDYLKGILILLVISFHLVYFEHLYPYAKQVVFSFHMPGFLLISGFLMNIGKAPRDFLHTLLWLAVPYLFMEGGYIILASLLPINDHIDHLTAGVFLDRLILHPLGPPWYFHTLLICGGIYYLILHSQRQPPLSTPDGRPSASPTQSIQRGVFFRLLLTGIAYYAVSYVLSTLLPLKGVGGTFAFSSSLYFLLGATIRQSGRDFSSIFWASPIALLLFALLITLPLCFTLPFSLFTFPASLIIVYFAISSLLWLYRISPHKESQGIWGSLENLGSRGSLGISFLGRNSLPLYVFSPVFTILCKRFVPYLQFDPTGLIFLFVSLVVCVSGCLLIAWLMDVTGISPYFFGKKAIRN